MGRTSSSSRSNGKVIARRWSRRSCDGRRVGGIVLLLLFHLSLAELQPGLEGSDGIE
jgi:hypothetical protein